VKLYEFEGHKILAKGGIGAPFFVVCENLEEVNQGRKRFKFPIVAKVQVLSGKRGKGGGIKICVSEKQLTDFCKKMFGEDFAGEKVRFISLAQKVDIEKELYASITYDTVLRLPFLLFSAQGGVGIEEVGTNNSEMIARVDIDPMGGLSQKDLKKVVGRDAKLGDFLVRLWDVFVRYDCRLLEVNPIGKVKQSVILEGVKRPIGSKMTARRIDSIVSLQNDIYVAIDAKVILDDNGLARHRDLDILPKGAGGAIPTKREIDAKKIDEEDYRGSAGSTFIEFDGDIAILASGGGASLLVMDTVVDAGGRCANYTEYSGNPPGDKVEKLTQITLSREGLSGCLVAGAVANFTDIYETLSGFARGLKKIRPKPTYPIVIRRGGPRQKEAYEMLNKLAKDEGFDIHLFGPETPISVACKKMVSLSQEYKKRLKK